MWTSHRRRIAAFFGPTHALPVDLFRVLVGLLGGAYFIHLFVQVGDISSPNGLIDHTLVRELFWYTRMGLFNPWMGESAFRVIYMIAVAGCMALVVGYRVRAAAAVVFLTAVSAYRWNFVVIYVDDAIMHLAFFWLLLLPIGRTLVLREWRTEGQAALARWKSEVVPGAAVHACLVNLMLVYLIAALWKMGSPMWRDGTALYAVLRMPMSYSADFWRPEHLPFLRAAGYGALVVEALLPAMFILRTGHPMKWLLLVSGLGFHLGIIATLRIPYANIACMAGAVLVFRHEIMRALAGEGARFSAAMSMTLIRWREAVALGFIVLLTLAMAGEAWLPQWRVPTGETPPTGAVDGQVGFMRSEHNVLYYPLWMMGIAQSYRLFDWVDERNFHVHYDATERLGDGRVAVPIDPRELFPPSLRGVLLQAYLHGVTWGKIPQSRAAEFRQALFTRFAGKYCRAHPNTGEIQVRTDVERITTQRTRAVTSDEHFMAFACHARVATVSQPRFDATLASGGSGTAPAGSLVRSAR